MGNFWRNWKFKRKLRRASRTGYLSVRERKARTKRRWIAALVAFLVLALGCTGLWLVERRAPWLLPWMVPRGNAPDSQRTLNVYYLDVGQADAAILTCDGHAMVIDGGNVGDAGLMYNTLRRELGVQYIDLMIATHPHEDHVGGLSGAINACGVGSFLTPVTEYDNRPFEITLDQARRKGARVLVPKPGDEFELGGARVEIVGPLQPSEDINNMSIVCRVRYGDTAFLFGGDAEREEEQDIAASRAQISADVLKANHHGSNSSSCAEFLKKVKPRWAIVSVADDNDFDHPSPKAMERLRDAGASVLCTDECGTIVCSSDGEKISFHFPNKDMSEDAE